MAKTKKNDIENFTMIPHWYWECGLDLIEVSIIARISSWQRQNKDFFEGYDTIALKFNCHYNTIRNTFNKLEKMGVIVKNGKVKRAWKWKVNELKLNGLKDSNTRCQNTDTFLHPMSELLTPDVSYNNPKNINKNILRVEENTSGVSSPSMQDIELLALSLDI